MPKPKTLKALEELIDEYSGFQRSRPRSSPPFRRLAAGFDEGPGASYLFAGDQNEAR
jgi:hypothetical protein